MEQLKDHMEAKHISKNATGLYCLVPFSSSFPFSFPFPFVSLFLTPPFPFFAVGRLPLRWRLEEGL